MPPVYSGAIVRSGAMQETQRSLALVAVVSKATVLASIFASPVLWDTSTRVLLENEAARPWLKALATRLMVWDNVYFVANASYGGARYEHELAFSSVWGALIRRLSPATGRVPFALTAAAASLVSHLLACVSIYFLTSIDQLRDVDPGIAAVTYSLCPAGVFLLSGYTESLFALTSFLGLLLFYKYQSYVASGAVLAATPLIRGNGILWGVPFLSTLLGELLQPIWSLKTMTRLVCGGLLVGAGFALSQYEAYRNYCPGCVWCGYRLPMVYTYVQSHYWNNGFLKYWTLGNLPNYFLGAPTFVLLYKSSKFLYRRGLIGLALVQLIVLVGAVFFWHAQIVTRLASCLPGPSWYLASELKGSAQARKNAKLWIAFFLVWIPTQAALYGAFLPPA